MQLSCVGKLRWQNSQAVVPQGQDTECHTAPDLRWQHLQAIPIHIEVGQLGQLSKGVGQSLAESGGKDQRSAEAHWG